jgi:hypothetical protein
MRMSLLVLVGFMGLGIVLVWLGVLWVAVWMGWTSRVVVAQLVL